MKKKKFKFPSTTVLIIASLGAFWLAGIINPGFNPVAIMILCLIPVLIFEVLYPQSEVEQLFEKVPPEEEENEQHSEDKSVSGELMSNEQR